MGRERKGVKKTAARMGHSKCGACACACVLCSVYVCSLCVRTCAHACSLSNNNPNTIARVVEGDNALHTHYMRIIYSYKALIQIPLRIVTVTHREWRTDGGFCKHVSYEDEESIKGTEATLRN